MKKTVRTRRTVICFTIILALFAGGVLPRIPSVEVKAAGLTGANDTDMNNRIKKSIEDFEKLPASNDWTKYLIEEWEKKSATFNWTNTTGMDVFPFNNTRASGTGDPAIDPDSIPKSNGDTFEVYSGQQLIFVLSLWESQLKDKTIILKKDIDLKGYEYQWKTIDSISELTIDGDGHTIYNLATDKGLIKKFIGSTMKNITFKTAKIVNTASDNGWKTSVGIVGSTSKTTGTNKRVTIDNVTVQDSIFFSGYKSIGGYEYISPLGCTKYADINNVATVRNIVFSLYDHVGGAFGRPDNSTIENSYSVDSQVIAVADHSGGFISCADGNTKVKNCFTNNEVYGNEKTGVFIGALVASKQGGEFVFENCYTSGSIEGTKSLGGFFGSGEYFDQASKATFINCYSTSLVGMRKGGGYLGGFAGDISEASRIEYVFKDCYAAGEVGFIDTDVSADRTTYKDVGGFIGTVNYPNIPNAISFTNCFYDKQTTAMREWATGMMRVDTKEKPGDNQIAGINGVLTSDSKKSGAGLASDPGAKGFTGFSGDVKSTNPNWVYDGNSDTKHNCMYPQLKVFFNGTSAMWGDHLNMVKAYSFASASTIHEQVWENCSEEEGLPEATYDTVRDLTLRFTMTSYIGADDADGNNIVWEKTGAKNSLYGEDVNVVGFLGKTHNDKYNRQYWTSDNFAVGIEWLKVNITVGTGADKAVGSRRIRVIPTSNLTPGKDKTDLIVGDKINHALDVYMAYSTGGRLSANWKDITTGVYPDLPYPASPSDPRIPIQGQSAPTEFTDSNDQFNDVKTTYMIPGNGGTQGHKHPNNVLKTALYKVIKVDDTGRIIFDDKNKIELTDDNSWGKRLNGKEAFASEDTGRYIMEYTWIMPDGRYMRDSKMLTIRDSQHNVSVRVQNVDKTKNSTSLEIAIDQYDYKQSKPYPDFKGSVSSFDKEIDRYKPALISAKKTNVDSLITEISMKITTIDGEQSKTFSNVYIGEKVTMPVKYYYGSHEDGGNYYVQTVTVNKEYTLDYDKNEGFYFIAVDNEWKDAASGIEYRDIDFDIELLITVKENLGSLHVTKNTYVDGKLGFTNDVFPIEITNDKGYISTLLLESTKDKNDALIKLNNGTYTLKELLPMNYEYQSIVIDGVTITDPEVEFEIKEDETVKIIINNKKISKLGGSSSVENKLDKFR